jgi:hypothetical protein
MGNIFNGLHVFAQNTPRTVSFGQTSIREYLRERERERSYDLF